MYEIGFFKKTICFGFDLFPSSERDGVGLKFPYPRPLCPCWEGNLRLRSTSAFAVFDNLVALQTLDNLEFSCSRVLYNCRIEGCLEFWNNWNLLAAFFDNNLMKK